MYFIVFVLSVFGLSCAQDCSRLKEVQAYLIDLDGTMYLGDGLIDGAKDFYNWLISTKKPYAFVSNSASKGPLGVQKRFLTPPWVLSDTPVPLGNIITAAQSLAYYMKDAVPAGSKIYFLQSVTKFGDFEDSCISTIQRTIPTEFSRWTWRTDMSDNEIKDWSVDSKANPGSTFVVNCVDGQVGDTADPVTGRPGYTDWNYSIFSKATWLLLNGAALITSAPDLSSPPSFYKGATIENPGPGTVHAMLAAVSFPGTINSTFIVGKGGDQGTKSTMIPAFQLLRQQGFNGSLSEVAMVGDTLYTDILAGVKADMKSVLVLSGVSKLSDRQYYPEAVPTCVLPNVGYIPKA